MQQATISLNRLDAAGRRRLRFSVAVQVLAIFPLLTLSVRAAEEDLHPSGQSVAPSNAVPGTGLPSAMFSQREMDMHLHSGLERQIPLDAWIDLAVNDGRKVLLLLDHLELYRGTADEFAKWQENEKVPKWYTRGPEGHKAFFADLDAARGLRKDVVIFRGWEVYEGELDTGIEEDPMLMADCIGWHISPNGDKGAPNGETVLGRVRQIMEVQKRVPVPMIVFHPFTARIERIQKDAKRAGRDPGSITAAEYRFFTEGQQAALIDLLKGASIYIEMSKKTEDYWNDPAIREALMADIKPLALGGVQFTVSTDNHTVPHAKEPYEPERYLLDCGITPANTNTIVRELLAARAKRQVSAAVAQSK